MCMFYSTWYSVLVDLTKLARTASRQELSESALTDSKSMAYITAESSRECRYSWECELLMGRRRILR